MSDEIFEPYSRLVEIKILGKSFFVPENNLLLRCYQYLAPDKIPFGNFCWNGECKNCRVKINQVGKNEAEEILSCQVVVEEGLEIIEISDDLEICLRFLLPSSKK